MQHVGLRLSASCERMGALRAEDARQAARVHACNRGNALLDEVVGQGLFRAEVGVDFGNIGDARTEAASEEYRAVRKNECGFGARVFEERVHLDVSRLLFFCPIV